MRKILPVIMMTAATAAAGQDRCITVCMAPGADVIIIHRAQWLASDILSSVGVRIHWRDPAYCRSRESTIDVNLLYETPENVPPQTFGYARLFERRIVIFYGRLQWSRLRPECFLSYLLAHEIGHVLQATGRHSNYGVMKELWNELDYKDMLVGHLRFTREDAILIQRGLTARPLRPSGSVLLTVK